MIKKFELKKLNKLKKKLKQLPKLLAEHIFGFFMVLVFIYFILGGIIFYIYSFSAEKIEPVASQVSIQYKENTFKNVLNQWLERERKFEEAETKQYPDLFNLTQ